MVGEFVLCLYQKASISSFHFRKLFFSIELQDNIVKFAPSASEEAGLACVEYDDQEEKWKFAALSIRDPLLKSGQ